ncbi:MAG: hypothetical protein ACWGQW_19490, partial [bacterium]
FPWASFNDNVRLDWKIHPWFIAYDVIVSPYRTNSFEHTSSALAGRILSSINFIDTKKDSFGLFIELT